MVQLKAFSSLLNKWPDCRGCSGLRYETTTLWQGLVFAQRIWDRVWRNRDLWDRMWVCLERTGLLKSPQVLLIWERSFSFCLCVLVLDVKHLRFADKFIMIQNFFVFSLVI